VRSAALAAGALFAALLLPGCQPDRPRNLVLISIDTLRADHLGCYGYQRPTSPAIDAVAEAGVVFEDASATSPWTFPSHASLLTGLYPRRHGASQPERALAGDVIHIAAWLQQHGFRTAAVVNSTWFKRPGMRKGFDDFVFVPETVDAREPSRVTELALLRLRRFDRATPFFLFLHYYDVHSDYRSMPEYERMFAGDYRGRANGSTRQLLAFLLGRTDFEEDDVRHLRDLYDAGIRQLDDQLAKIFRDLRNRGLLDQTLLVVTADHGEEFLEHGSLLHGATQYQEVIRAPLVFAGAGIPAGVRVTTPVSLVDVMPTTLAVLGVPIPDSLDGIDLQSLWKQPDPALAQRLLFLDATRNITEQGRLVGGSRRGVRWGRFKLEHDAETRESRLFDLTLDPAERHDVEDTHPEVAARLFEALKEYLEQAPASRRSEPLGEEERRLLESLGYLR
jgi:arylsulfatase A-like enzyme